MSRDGLISLIARGGVVASRPFLIFFIAQYDELIASNMARLLFWSVFLTSAASMSVYKNYMEKALNDGLLAILPRIVIHSWYYIIFLALLSVITNLWIVAIPFFLDFFFHQISRVLLYQKKFILWAACNLLSLILVSLSFLLLYDSTVYIYVITVLFATFFGIAFVMYKLKESFHLAINWNEAFFGTSRKLYFSADKLLLTILLMQDDFWIWAVIFQLSNIGLTAFDAVVVAPNKKEIVLNKLKYGDVDVLFPGCSLALVSGAACAFFYFFNTQSMNLASVVFLCFSFRSTSSCLLNFILEFYFWRESVGRVSLIMLTASAFFAGFSYLCSGVLGDATILALSLVCFQGLSMVLLLSYASNQLRVKNYA